MLYGQKKKKRIESFVLFLSISPEPSRNTKLNKYGKMNFEFTRSLVSALVPVDVGDAEMELDRCSALTCSQYCPICNCRISVKPSPLHLTLLMR